MEASSKSPQQPEEGPGAIEREEGAGPDPMPEPPVDVETVFNRGADFEEGKATLNLSPESQDPHAAIASQSPEQGSELELGYDPLQFPVSVEPELERSDSALETEVGKTEQLEAVSQEAKANTPTETEMDEAQSENILDGEAAAVPEKDQATNDANINSENGGVFMSPMGSPAQSSTGIPVATAVAVPEIPEAQVVTEAEDEESGLVSPHKSYKVVEKSPTERYTKFNDKLGVGQYKTVWRAFDTMEGIEVAWCSVNLTNIPKSERPRIKNEVVLLQDLKHDNIINFYGSWLEKENKEVVFITEILSSGSLKEFIRKMPSIRWRIIKRWLRSILQGLRYLHSRTPPVIHRDLKCDNIFLNGNNTEIRIGDFGLSCRQRDVGTIMSVLGTPEFMAPELYDESYDEKVDIYAFGMCCLEMITKDRPYSECSNPAQIYKKVTSQVLPKVLPQITNPKAQEFIKVCLNADARQRPTAEELLGHAFLQDDPEYDDAEVIIETAYQMEGLGVIPEEDQLDSSVMHSSREGKVDESNSSPPIMGKKEPAKLPPKSDEAAQVGQPPQRPQGGTPDTPPRPTAALKKPDAKRNVSDDGDDNASNSMTRNCSQASVLSDASGHRVGSDSELIEAARHSLEPNRRVCSSSDMLSTDSSHLPPGTQWPPHAQGGTISPELAPQQQQLPPRPALIMGNQGIMNAQQLHSNQGTPRSSNPAIGGTSNNAQENPEMESGLIPIEVVLADDQAPCDDGKSMQLKVQLPLDGKIQEIEFDYHLEKDNPAIVAEEMVEELGLPKSQISTIVEAMDDLAFQAREQKMQRKKQSHQNLMTLQEEESQQKGMGSTSRHSSLQNVYQGEDMSGSMEEMSSSTTHKEPDHRNRVVSDSTHFGVVNDMTGGKIQQNRADSHHNKMRRDRTHSESSNLSQASDVQVGSGAGATPNLGGSVQGSPTDALAGKGPPNTFAMDNQAMPSLPPSGSGRQVAMDNPAMPPPPPPGSGSLPAQSPSLAGRQISQQYPDADCIKEESFDSDSDEDGEAFEEREDFIKGKTDYEKAKLRAEKAYKTRMSNLEESIKKKIESFEAFKRKHEQEMSAFEKKKEKLVSSHQGRIQEIEQDWIKTQSTLRDEQKQSKLEKRIALEQEVKGEETNRKFYEAHSAAVGKSGNYSQPSDQIRHNSDPSNQQQVLQHGQQPPCSDQHYTHELANNPPSNY